MKRPKVIAGNWKMYKTVAEAADFVKKLAPLVAASQPEVLLAVPYTAIRSARDAAQGSKVQIGAQNMNDAREGAFTGEISASMLLDAGAQFVVLGHSERRHIFGESNQFINRKVKRALKEGLRVILCVGESSQEREADQTEEVLRKQLEESLSGIEEKQRLIVAYEPVWAIGTGRSASAEIAQQTHFFLRSLLGEEVWMLYGGSVKPDNVAEFLSQPDIDGVLVGGASLDPESFAKIVQQG
ncbi:MAG: triose-phosphate isomerase [Verrucomicrobia bacterium]|nr:triose-phosphate isomerase [Verrucomicrobiota bacterium]